jgi:hypothetical protein
MHYFKYELFVIIIYKNLSIERRNKGFFLLLFKLINNKPKIITLIISNMFNQRLLPFKLFIIMNLLIFSLVVRTVNYIFLILLLLLIKKILYIIKSFKQAISQQ